MHKNNALVKDEKSKYLMCDVYFAALMDDGSKKYYRRHA